MPVGDFGLTVAQELTSLLPEIEVLPEASHGGVEAALQNSTAIAVLAAWHPVPAISELLDARSFGTGTPFISIALQDCTLVLGPIVVPGSGSCWRCGVLRDMQSSSSPSLNHFRTNYYADRPSDGPQGYFASLALLGAAQVVRVLESIQTTADRFSGQIIRTDIFARWITIARAVGFDNCDRCGLKRPLGTRSYADLRLNLGSLWDSE